LSKKITADIFESLTGNVDIAALGEDIAAASGVLKCDGAGNVSATTDEAGIDSTALHDNVSGEISAITEKTAPVSADMLVIEDSEASSAKKMVQVGNLPLVLTDNQDAASAANVGKMRYYVSGTVGYVDVVMQTGTSTYAWVNILIQDWT
jgi:hypothetical protein